MRSIPQQSTSYIFRGRSPSRGKYKVELPFQGQVEGNIKWNYPLMMTQPRFQGLFGHERDEEKRPW